jgi:uncharacterized protein (DUF2249 family)
MLKNPPGYRVVLLNMRCGQNVPERATKEMLTAYAIFSRTTCYGDHLPENLHSGEVRCIDGGVPHRIEWPEDSALLVLAAGIAGSTIDDELDLREVPRPRRYLLVFAKLDGLAIGESFVLIHDYEPVPLNRQIETMHSEQMAWEYFKREVDIFCIRVRRIAPSDGWEISTNMRSEGLLHKIHRV